MKALLFALLFAGNLSMLFGQPPQDIIIKKMANDSIINIDTLVGIKNKRLIFEYDTLYIINKFGISEFVRCAGDLNSLKKSLPAQLSTLTGDLSDIQTNVDSMYFNMKSVTSFINTYEKETKLKLDALNAHNTELAGNLETLKKELEDTRQKIKAERWKTMGSKVIWGAGGFAFGGLIFSSLILLK